MENCRSERIAFQEGWIVPEELTVEMLAELIGMHSWHLLDGHTDEYGLYAPVAVAGTINEAKELAGSDLRGRTQRGRTRRGSALPGSLSALGAWREG